ncbi:hypothetical protein GCM10009557_47640 [Virgisporangium ochraceum]|uniref:Uncharacterized protein n=1 Tax=Virgisporangium ochraceum TaxID=65505 RepID=A0A8J4EKM7_9ACTN|nr:hypothetical protein [Virgisporangium ochraceum]GIJ75522.1 hypothetical protein Voc01_104390 [Virgisporangium ochraceum]
MPSIDLTTLPGSLVRPFVVAIAHLPILIIVMLLSPTWVCGAFRSRAHGAATLKLLCELRGWSSDVVAGSASRRPVTR